MEHLVRFRSLSVQLNDEEFSKFIVQTLKSHGRALFTQSFFSNFTSNPQGITSLTDIVTKIINSREKGSNQQYSANKIDQLPSELIGECASFLSEKKYFLFAKSNRKIYLSCYSPCKLYKLSMSLFHKYPQSMSMGRFKSIKSLSISIPGFNSDLSASNKSIWCSGNTFNKLEISNHGGNENDVKQFFDSNIIENNNIKQITLSAFGTLLNSYNGLSFCNNILSKLSIIEHIHFSRVYLSNTVIKDDYIREWFTNLKILRCLCTNDHPLFKAIIRVIGHQLEALRIDKSSDIDVPTQGFAKLQELSLIFPNMNVMNAFKNVTTLKVAKIASSHTNILKTFVVSMIQNQISLECLQINLLPHQLNDVMGYIEVALFNCGNNENFAENNLNKKLHIEFHRNNCKDDMIDNMCLSMVRLINMINVVNIKHFRLHFINDLGTGFDKKSKTMHEWLLDIDKMKQKYLIHYEFQTKQSTDIDTFLLTVSNKDCVINRYSL